MPVSDLWKRQDVLTRHLRQKKVKMKVDRLDEVTNRKLLHSKVTQCLSGADTAEKCDRNAAQQLPW